MLIENEFEIAAPPETVWLALNDVERVAPCFPGARLDTRGDDGAYTGEVKVKLGPVAVTFAGRMQQSLRDDDARKARFDATASDRKGRGELSSTIDFHVQACEAGTRISVATEVQLAGAVAQYGRGAGMIKRLAARNVEQFAHALAGRLAQDTGGAPA